MKISSLLPTYFEVKMQDLIGIKKEEESKGQTPIESI